MMPCFNVRVGLVVLLGLLLIVVKRRDACPGYDAMDNWWMPQQCLPQGLALHGEPHRYPSLTARGQDQARLADLIQLLRANGDAEMAAKYQSKLDLLNQQKAVENISVGQAKQKVEQAEAALRRAITYCEKLEEQFVTAQDQVQSCSEAVDYARSIYKQAVQKLAKTVDTKLPDSADAPAAPRLDLAAILDGKPLDLDDGGRFGPDALGELASPEDLAEAQKRKEALQEKFRELATVCFGQAK
ncbi:unnamed protein product, partial [Prorocentrum cordatum]